MNLLQKMKGSKFMIFINIFFIFLEILVLAIMNIYRPEL